MCIEGSGGGVVDVDGGDDAHLVVLLGMELLGDGLIGHIAGPGTHIDDAALGLVAGGDGSGSGSGVGAERSAVVGGHTAHLGELGEAQLALDDSAVVLHRTLIESGGLDLGRTHAVADEEENILGFSAEHAQQSVLFLCCVGGIGGSGVGSGRRCGQHTGGGCKGTGLQKAAAGHFILFHAKVLSFHEPHGSFSLFRFIGNGLILPPQPPGPKPCGRKIGVKPRRRLWAVCKKEDFCCAKSAPPVKRRGAFVCYRSIMR